MTSTSTQYKYIVLDDHNVPIIIGTSMKIIELITAVKAYGWSPEILHDNYPHLTLSKIHSALAYYWDHQEEIDQAIEADVQWAEATHQRSGESPFVARLRDERLK